MSKKKDRETDVDEKNVERKKVERKKDRMRKMSNQWKMMLNEKRYLQ